MRNDSLAEQLTRRRFLRTGLAGALGLSLPHLLQMRAGGSTVPAGNGFGRARRCIVFFCWGGMSHLETLDPKPNAPAEYRGDYRSIPSVVPGTRLGEFMAPLATATDRIAIVRSVRHPEAGHRNAAYWALTGHPPHTPGNDTTILPSRRDWPCLGSMVGRFRSARPGFPGSASIPYFLADRGLVNGQGAGFLGLDHEPLVVHPRRGRAYEGISPSSGVADLGLPPEVDASRMHRRLGMLEGLQTPSSIPQGPATRPLDHYRSMATDLLLSPEVAGAFDLEREPSRTRTLYGDHVCGQSTLLARRLSEAGVPIVTVYPCAGDLNGSAGAHWDTHGNNFARLRDQLLPPLQRAYLTLLDDLAARGLLDETLVVWLTEFGRTPRVNGSAGRDHFPNCFSVAFAGGGIRGGLVHGRSDPVGAEPAEQPCGPADLHATIFHALGIPLDSHVQDSLGRPLALCDGHPLPLF